MQLSKESNEARAQLEKKKKEIGKLKDQVDQMTIQNNQLEGQLNDARQSFADQIMQCENENND